MEIHKNYDIEEYIESLIETQTNVVFVCGDTGAGKTCFLATIIKYLKTYHRITLNSRYNKEGIKHINRLVTGLDNLTLPPASSIGEIREVDICVTANNHEAIFTFLDISGEDLRKFDPAKESTLGDTVGELDLEIEKYLIFPDLPVIVLCFIDYDKPAEQDLFFLEFFSYLESRGFKFHTVAAIITKWDKNNKHYTIQDYLSQCTPQCYLWLDQRVVNRKAFPFSIGTINDTDNKKLDSLDLSYCKGIVDWLFLSSRKRIPPPADKSLLKRLTNLRRYIDFAADIWSFLRRVFT